MIDSTADLPDYADRFANLRMVPLTVRFGDEADLRDHVDLDADAFYARLALASVPPKTSAPAPQAFAECRANGKTGRGQQGPNWCRMIPKPLCLS